MLNKFFMLQATQALITVRNGNEGWSAANAFYLRRAYDKCLENHGQFRETMDLLEAIGRPPGFEEYYATVEQLGNRLMEFVLMYGTAWAEHEIAFLQQKVDDAALSRRLALCMGMHPRLGQDSLLQRLDDATMAEIAFDY